MQGNRGRDTGPEMAVRRAVHAMGLRYRVGVRPVQTLRRTADLVFTRQRVAVFIDGCFWHGCPVHYTVAKTNASYWSDKVVRNRERDNETNDALLASGWTVLRFWEHDDPAAVAQAIRSGVIQANEGHRDLPGLPLRTSLALPITTPFVAGFGRLLP